MTGGFCGSWLLDDLLLGCDLRKLEGMQLGLEGLTGMFW